MSHDEQREFLVGLGLGEPARNVFIRTAYRLLDLISFLTAGPDECRAWPIRRGTVARKAAGKVHSDIERGFIRAEIYRLDDLKECGSEAALKARGKLRVEGKDYVMQDGDVVNFRFNV
jgi:ribosome-binding ATPase YchF (GTP1/OBG family)